MMSFLKQVNLFPHSWSLMSYHCFQNTLIMFVLIFHLMFCRTGYFCLVFYLSNLIHFCFYFCHFWWTKLVPQKHSVLHQGSNCTSEQKNWNRHCHSSQWAAFRVKLLNPWQQCQTVHHVLGKIPFCVNCLTKPVPRANYGSTLLLQPTKSDTLETP